MGRGGKRTLSKVEMITCQNCGSVFQRKEVGCRPRFCSNECKSEAGKKLYRINNPKLAKQLTCKQCGKGFESYSLLSKYCSKECQNISDKENRKVLEKMCPQCGVTFTTTDRGKINCSVKCGQIAAHEKMKKYYTCQYCGQLFSGENAFRMKYCTPDCFKAAIRARTIERHKNDPLPVVYSRVCAECGTEFETSFPNQIYCSSMCGYNGNLRLKREQWSADYVPRNFICKECGTEVITTCGDTRSTFCSDRCLERFTDQAGKQKRKELMKVLFVKTVRFKNIYKRDNGTCQICGLPVAIDKSPERIWAATIDHVVPLSLGGTHEPDNCQLAHRLCNSLKLQDKGNFYVDWELMLEKDSVRWSTAIDEYWEYMDTTGKGGNFLALRSLGNKRGASC